MANTPHPEGGGCCGSKVGRLRRSLPAACLQAVADGVFYAELNELLMRELGGEGYSGVEVRSAMAAGAAVGESEARLLSGSSQRHLFSLQQLAFSLDCLSRACCS